MSATSRQIVGGIGFSILISVLTVVIFITVFPVSDWRELWNRQLMGVPFILFVPVLCIAVGVLFGAFSGLFWRRQLLSIDHSLHQLEEGRMPGFKVRPQVTELQSLGKRIEKIGKQISEQAVLSQRMATKKAVDQEITIQEMISQERSRLARELHDSVSQQLFAASMLMSAINETNEESTPEMKQLKMVEEMIHQSQLEMRALLLHLRPAALKNKSLQEGIEELLLELTQKVNMKISWKIEQFPLDKGVEDHLFRILQESVSNTLRHAKAKKMEVLLIKRGDQIILRVSDDGAGFEIKETKAGSYGMQNMHERALEIGGTLKVISLKGKGTRLEVKVPALMGDGGID